MNASRRDVMLSGLAAGALAWGGRALSAEELQQIRLCVGLKTLNVTFLNVMIGQQLGFDRQLGFSLSGSALGALSSVLIALDRGQFQFGIVSPSVALPVYAKGEWPPIVTFYEYTYPYKWDVTVLPGSPIKSYQDLRGKKIGVSNMGTTDYPVTREVLRNIGIDPDKDVHWIAVGEGITAGVALQRGVIDALAYFDTGFGLIEAAGIKMRYLPRPPKVPMIGGFFIAARRDFVKEQRATCIAFGKSIAMATVYTLANPAAAARAFLQMYPNLAPRNVSPEVAVAHTVEATARRIKLYEPPYPGAKLGSIQESEWREEVNFAGLKIPDVKPLFTNELIDEINDFDHAKVIALAKAAKA